MRFAIALALLTVSCSSGGGSTTPPPTPSPPSPAVAACSIPVETAVLSEGAASAPKSDVADDRRTRRGRVGDKISLGDDASVRIPLPFTFPYYSRRYTEAFLNSDGNVTFVSEDHASTDRNVARFLTGPPRVAPIFADLDPSKGAGVFRRTD